MNLNESLNQMSKSLLDFFFPRHCPFCGRVTGKTLLCEKCEKTLPKIVQSGVQAHSHQHGYILLNIDRFSCQNVEH